MGRLLVVLGIILVVAGLGGMVAGFTGIGSNFMSTINDAINPTASDSCNPGETLDKELGSETYSPTTGYGRSVSYYCVNDAGERREVTGEFVQGMLGQVFGSVPTLLIPALGGCILTLGILLLVVGFILSARKRGAVRLATQSYAFDFPSGEGAPPAARRTPRQASGDLTSKLRQLDEARQANLISEDEYQRMRQDILDSMD